WTAGSVWPQVMFALAACVVVAAFWLIRARMRAPLAGALFFALSLFPVLGFLDVYPFVFSFVADHFQYLASLGLIVPAAAGAAMLLDRGKEGLRRLAPVFAVVTVATLGVLTWQRSHDFRAPRTLYETTLARNPGCYLCLNNLGTMAYESGRPQEALDRFLAA